MRAAICSVGLVSPRSTWESMGADTPERSARSRNERSIASRSALTRGPTAATVGSAAAAITPVRYHVRSRRRCGEAHTGRPRRAGSLGAMERPDVLVLGAGGTLGEAWMRGLLSGLDDGGGPDLRECASFVGTSAGSIVAATLAAGERLEAGDHAARDWAQEAQDEPERLTGVARQAARAGLAVAGPLAHFTLTAAAPAGRLARAAALRAAPRPGTSLAGLGRDIVSLGARFDGRLRIAAVDRASGRRVMFGEPDAPPATVRDAVLASCAVPWIFAPVKIGEREYVDGGVWSLTNLDAAPAARGARVWCLIPTAGTTIAALRRASTGAARAEALALRSRGVRVRTIVPDVPLGRNLMDPRRRGEVIAAGYAQGRRLMDRSG